MKARTAFAFVVALAAMAIGSPAAQGSDPTICSGFLLAVTVDNVVVPSGVDCVMLGTHVRGSVLVERNGSLETHEGGIPIVQTRIRGNVYSDYGRYVRLFDTSSVDMNVTIKGATEGFNGCDTGPFIGGNLQFEEMVGDDVIAHACGCQVRGNLVVTKTRGALVDVDGSTIFGNLQVSENTATEGLLIFANNVRGELQYFKNNGPAAIFGNLVLFNPPDPLPGGNLQITDNTGEAFLIEENQVAENLQFFKNKGPSNISGNMVGEDLQCKDNSPPAISSGNTVGGNNECPG